MLIKDRNHKNKVCSFKKVQYFIKVKFRRLLAVIGHCRAWIDYKIRKHYSTRFGRYCVLSTNHRESIYFAIKMYGSLVCGNQTTSLHSHIQDIIGYRVVERCIDMTLFKKKKEKKKSSHVWKTHKKIKVLTKIIIYPESLNALVSNWYIF